MLFDFIILRHRTTVVHHLLRASGPNSILRTVGSSSPFDILIQ